MRRWIQATILALLLWAATVPAAERLRLVADAWAPFTDTQLLNGGLATDLVSTALARAGYLTTYEQAPWARAMLGIEEGRYDVLINAWFNHERSHYGQFSQPYLQNRIRFLKRSDTALTEWTREQLRQLRIAVVRGYAYAPDFDHDPDLHKVPVHSFSMAVRMLVAGRVDLTLEDEYVARYYLAMEDPAVRDKVQFLPQPLAENGLHILVSLKQPQHAQIVARFDQAITEMKADGSYDMLFKRHGL